jgi:hypothetical protein
LIDSPYFPTKSWSTKIAALCKLHVNIGVLAVVIIAARSRDQKHNVAARTVLQTVSVAAAGLEPGRFAGMQEHVASIGEIGSPCL